LSGGSVLHDSVVPSREVAAALQAGLPVVALESAVLTHGLPRPENLETYLAVEAAVRVAGAVPAAVALVGGALRVGLDRAELERLAAPGAAAKAGLGDLPALAAQGAHAGTTVAATLWAASRAKISVFATGGIGGVHRGAATSFDISGDLGALARFGGCVVCSGAKVVLDLPGTLQVLESLGVCVLGYRTREFPAFVCAGSGLPLRHSVATPEAAAEVVRARDRLGLSSSVLLANPPPGDAAVPREVIEAVVNQAVAEAASRGVDGPALTPFLLAAVVEATGGKSLAANRALLVANATLAARVAKALRDEAFAPGRS